jgi:hypothetical protein
MAATVAGVELPNLLLTKLTELLFFWGGLRNSLAVPTALVLAAVSTALVLAAGQEGRGGGGPLCRAHIMNGG